MYSVFGGAKQLSDVYRETCEVGLPSGLERMVPELEVQLIVMGKLS